MKSLFATLVILYFSVISSLVAQENNGNWYHNLKTDDQPFNISTDAVYNSLVNKTPRIVVVAVIDSGIDIEHEDLDEIIWTNRDEIPNNGIDDDQNGYIDDIHGWNFLGNVDGSNVSVDTYEKTRIYAELKKKFENINPLNLSKNDKIDYNLYVQYDKDINKEREKAKKQLDELKETEDTYLNFISYMKDYFGDYPIDQEGINQLSQSPDRNALITSNIILSVAEEIGHIPTIEEVEEILLSSLEDAKSYYSHKYDYQYNHEFDSRHIVGDNFSDKAQTGYGNNDVTGPDAMHGTHVAGIIAAERNNDIGINGIANTVKIMVLRAVPDGDERDKDVANAIRYAVDNGAEIINMSFGKGQSPEKQIVDDAVRYAEKNDVLIIHAAGNSSLNIDEGNNNYKDHIGEENYPNDTYLKPKGFLFWKRKKAKNYITIGASSKMANEKMVDSFSNYGKNNVDIFAPGEYMNSTVPGNEYRSLQGTSFAAPVVSGVSALIRAYYPTLTAEQVIEALLESTSPLDIEVVKPGSDHEKVSFSELSLSGGIIDCKAAMEKAATKKGKRKAKYYKSRKATRV